VTAHEGGVLVAERHVDGAAHAAALLGRRHERCALFDRQPQRCAEPGVQDGGGVLQLASLAHDRCLAVALRLRWRDAKRLHAARAEQRAELFADGHEFVEVLLEAAGERVGDHRHRERLARGRRDRLPAFGVGFFDLHDEFADVGEHGCHSVSLSKY